MKNLCKTIILLVIVLCLTGCKFYYYNKIYLSRVEECIKCKSTRKVYSDREPTILHKNKSYESCKHSWRNIYLRRTNTAIQNSKIILVKKGKIIGAFIVKQGNINNKRVAFDWYYRTDGKGVFKKAESKQFYSGKGVSILCLLYTSRCV